MPEQPNRDWEAIEFVLCDLDGVVWLAHQAIAGAPEAVARLRAAGRHVLFVTNNSFSLIAEQETALAAIGIPALGDVVSSAQAAALLLSPGDTALVCGGPGVVEALSERQVDCIDGIGGEQAGVQAVVVGFHRSFDYERMRVATRSIQGGARLIATNDDATYPTPDGPIPGGGAIVASIAYATGRAPEIAGKPHPPMAELVRQRCGERFSGATALMVGDRWSTDGLFAATLGCGFAMVRSGVTPPGTDFGGVAQLDVADLASVADAVLGRGPADSRS